MIILQGAWLNCITIPSSKAEMYRPCIPQMPNTARWCAHSTRGVCYLVFFLQVQLITAAKGTSWYFIVREASHFSKWNQLCVKWFSISQGDISQMGFKGQLRQNHLEWFLHEQILRPKFRPTEPSPLGPEIFILNNCCIQLKEEKVVIFYHRL